MTTTGPTSRNSSSVLTTQVSNGAAVTPSQTALPSKSVQGVAAPLTADARDIAASQRLLGTAASRPVSQNDGSPVARAAKNIDEAFDQLACTGAGPAKVRRFADENPMAWNMVLDLARRAERTFDFSFFTIEKDPYGFAYMGAMLYNQLRGVQVTGMTNWSSNAFGRGFVSNGFGLDYMQELANAGAKVGVYNPPMKRVARFFHHGLSYGLLSCNHDKIAVKDKGTPAAEAETGGRNIAGAYHQDPLDNPKSWRDDSLHIVGQAACEGLATSIEREFEGPGVKILKPDLINFVSRARELLVAYALMEEWVAGPAVSAEEKAACRTSEPRRHALADNLFEAAQARVDRMVAGFPAEAREQVPARLSHSADKRLREMAFELTRDQELRGSRAVYEARGGFEDAEVKIVDQTGAASAAPKQRFNEIAADLGTLVHGAQESIIIQNPYVVLTEEMIQELEAAAARGVKITIVTNSPESTDSAVTQGFFLKDWPHILARVPTARIFVATGHRKFHAKCFVADHKVSGDMSYNLDLLSGYINGEIGAITRSPKIAQDLEARIAADLANKDNNFKEWTIKKDAAGKAVLDAGGRPIIVEGPSQDINPRLLRSYSVVKLACELFTHTDTGAPLKHPR